MSDRDEQIRRMLNPYDDQHAVHDDQSSVIDMTGLLENLRSAMERTEMEARRDPATVGGAFTDVTDPDTALRIAADPFMGPLVLREIGRNCAEILRQRVDPFHIRPIDTRFDVRTSTPLKMSDLASQMSVAVINHYLDDPGGEYEVPEAATADDVGGALVGAYIIYGFKIATIYAHIRDQ